MNRRERDTGREQYSECQLDLWCIHSNSRASCVSIGAPDKDESTTARSCFCAMKLAWVIPSTLRSLSAGTFIGPGEGADPGAGWGNAVDIAVWKVRFPSTFCM